MKHLVHTQKRFFWRRTGTFFLIMVIPTLIVYAFTTYLTILRTEREIGQKGQQTLTAVETNCELIVSNVFTQNDLLTGTTRMSMALKHTLFGTTTSYSDAIFLSSLRSVLKSVVNTHSYIDSIYIYLVDAPRYFDSFKGITDISTSPDLTWLPLYQAMPMDTKDMICLREGEYRISVLSFFRRMLMQNGCTVVNISLPKLKGILENQLTRKYETIVLLDNEGRTLASVSNDPNGSISQPELSNLTALMNGTNNYTGWYKPGSKAYYVNASMYDDMVIVAATSARLMHEQALTSISSFLWVLALNLVIILSLSYVTTQRSFSQIEHMLDMFNLSERGLPVQMPEKRTRDEYDEVMNNIIYMFLKETRLRSQLQQQRIEKEHSELMALQLQINPHFLYNTLLTLELEIKSGKSSPIDTSDLVQRISDILRYALSDPQKTVPLRDELKYLRKYAAVQQYRFGDRFILYFDLDDELSDIPVFRLMLQPLVENSLFHGMKPSGERLYIWAKAERLPDGIRISVSDTGVGMTEEQIAELIKRINDAESRSIGLTNLNRRLRLYYGDENGLIIKAKPGEGTEISFVIPLSACAVKPSEADD